MGSVDHLNIVHEALSSIPTQHFKNETSLQKLEVSKGPPAHSQEERSVGCLCFLCKDLMTFIKLPTFPSPYTPGCVPSAHTSAAPVTLGPSRKELVTLHPVTKEKAEPLCLPAGSPWTGGEFQTLPFLIVSVAQ